MHPDLPPHEMERLQSLRDYEILDTPPESTFDDMVRLASSICGTPISLVSLVDGERQWFKANLGLGASETHRDLAFCAYAILHPEEVLYVPDALEDPRFAANPLVLGDPHIRFYAGAPLVDARGRGLGTLCVIDRQPRRLAPHQVEALQILSRLVMAQLEQRREILRLRRDLASPGLPLPSEGA